MLFYDTEGEFGSDDFSIVAHEFFLLNIGSGTYTEYDTSNNPHLVPFLMANPSLLPLKKGHIHSHNTMGVFFSGTDDNELTENSECHNFYLSLIVNNKNEMIAKVAFRAMSTGTTKTKMIFKGVDGKETTKEMDIPFEEEVVYFYNCLITNLFAADDSFTERISILQKEVRVAREAKEAKERESLTNYNSIAGGSRAMPGHMDFSKYPKKELIPYPEDDDLFVLSDRVKEAKADPRTYSMLIKLLNLDFLYEGGSLESTLKGLEERFYPEESEVGLMGPQGRNAYLDMLEDVSTSYYIDSFPEDQHCLGFNKCMDDCVEIIEFYEDSFSIASDIAEALNISIVD